MSSEHLTTILEEIRDQQLRQITNFERAIDKQEQAMEIHRRGRRVLIVVVVLPWVLIAALLLMMVLD